MHYFLLLDLLDYLLKSSPPS